MVASSKISACLLSVLLTSTNAFSPSPYRAHSTLQTMPNSKSTHLSESNYLESISTGDSKKTSVLVPNLPTWDPTNWTTKRLHNTPLFRSAAILAAISLAGYSTSTSSLVNISTKTAAMLHVLSFGTFLGTNVYTTFIAGITMYKNLPRQQFGKLQAKLFPLFFNLCSIATLLQIVTLNKLPKIYGTKSLIALGITLGTTLFNQFLIEPISTKIMFQRYDMEKNGKQNGPEYKKLAASFGMFHGISSLMNLTALCGAVAHGWYIASALVA